MGAYILKCVGHMKATMGTFYSNDFYHCLGIPGGDKLMLNQLTFLYNTFCQALDIGKEVRVVFCDIRKAFDRVWHAGLLRKLKAAGVQGELLKWFTNYLAERKERVILPGVRQTGRIFLLECRKAPYLGPILFLIYNNDIVAEIGSSIRLFADDTSLYIIVENPITSAVCLNSDLSKISIWANNWLVDFNPPIFMQEIQIAEVSSHKHLGLVLSNDCTWHQHIDYITKKAWNRINIMRKLKFKLDRSSLEIIFTTFIRPLLEYGDIVWDNCTQFEKQEIE